MGEQKVSLLKDKNKMGSFVNSLLDDINALSFMLENEWFESGVIRIGAEQEMVLVNKSNYKPATVAVEALELLKDYPWVETELAKFNLETNLNPHIFEGKCLSALHKENSSKIDLIQEKLNQLDTSVLLTGILPTLRKYDLGMHNLTPKKRYKALMKAINEQLLGKAYEVRIVGIDELKLKHDSPLIEACNTSFQVHLQVDPKDFVNYYNLSQVLAAPVIAISANSPLVFGKRLWHESRIALFQQALDTRSSHSHMRERSPRVHFGNGWLKKSILEIYKEDIARFRALISADIEEDSMALIRDNKVPKLHALQVHNSTVYRWNRPCYGISDNGKPHLRIENRVLPAGPTVQDEMANAAFWLGCMIGGMKEYGDVRNHLSFEDARDNFGKSARFGIDSKFTWFNDEKVSVTELIIEELLPLAEKGLQSRNIEEEDISKYLSIIRSRAEKHTNGARWMLKSYTKLLHETTRDEALSTLTAAMLNNQTNGTPVHDWELAELRELKEYLPSSLKVEEFMTTDLFTVQKDDIIKLVSEMMNWRKIRYMPVEDKKGNLVGLVTSRTLLKHYISPEVDKIKTVAEIMIKKPVTINPEGSLLEAMGIMKNKKIGCLPVISHVGELIGIITEMDFLRISSRLLERLEE